MIKNIKEYYKNSSNLQMAVKTVTKNSFVQALIIFFIGFTILYFSKSSSMGYTVGVTLMSASVFKFLLTSNAFTIQVSKILKPIVYDNFISLDFINSYQDSKLLDIIERALYRFFELEFPQGNKKITKEFMRLIRGTGVYFQKASISVQDTNKTSYVESTTTKKYEFTITDNKKFNKKRKFTSQLIDGLTTEEHFSIVKLTIDEQLVYPSLTHETFRENNIEMVRAFYEWPGLSNGNHKVEEIVKMADIECIHVFSFSYPCLEFTISFKHDNSIVKPIIYTKYGRQNPSNVNGRLESKLKDGIILPNEKVFISYDTKKD